MKKTYTPGLGEQLRHLVDLVDRGSEFNYRSHNLPVRPRYTPLLRALSQGMKNVKQLTEYLKITQGAVSQTLKLLEKQGLIQKQRGTKDARESIVELTNAGKSLINELEVHWQSRFKAIKQLERDVGMPVEACLNALIEALEQKTFDQRIREQEDKLKTRLSKKKKRNSKAKPLSNRHKNREVTR